VKQTAVVAVVMLLSGIVLAFGEQSRDELYQELSDSLDRAEAAVADQVWGEERISQDQLDKLESLNLQIRGSLYSDLIDRSDLLLLLAREQTLLQPDPGVLEVREELLLRDSRQEGRNRSRNSAREKVLRAGLTTTFASFAAAFTLWGLGELQDRRYFESTTSKDATLHRRLFQVFSIGSVVAATVGVVGAGVSVTLYAGSR
jgi:hypothetical protein